MKTSPFDNQHENTWCPGCGNFGIQNALKAALEASQLSPKEVLIVSGIGQAAKLPHFMNANAFNGLHGRALPAALGAQVANSTMKIIVATGDGDALAEGGNHFIHNMRRNLDLVHLLHDNQVYGLTKGQAAPTTPLGQKTSLQTTGVRIPPLNPVTLALSVGCTFVARGFSGNPIHLQSLIEAAIKHKGYAMIDVLQPCVSFNKVNTNKWYKDHTFMLPESHDSTNLVKAFEMSLQWGEETGIPLGIFYQDNRPAFLEGFDFLQTDNLSTFERTPQDIQGYLNELTL